MGFWDTVGQGALDIGTLGMDRIPGAKNFLFGGDATKSIDSMPSNYNAATAQLGQIAQQAGGRAAPTVTAAQLDPTQITQSRAGLLGAAQGLGRIASGQQAGAGELAVNRQVSGATAAQIAAARMARGANAALALRNAARNTADLGLAGAGQAAQAQMADAQAAQAAQVGAYNSLYGNDANVAQQNAYFNQQAGLANQNSQLVTTAQNDAARIQALGQQLGWDQARITAEIQKAQIAAGDKGIFPSLLQAGGAVAAAGATGGASTMSDVRLKHDIQSGQAVANRAVATLAPLAYRYNDPAHGVGPQLGTSAQDLERAGLAHVVIDTPKGKAIDGGKLSTANTAMIAALGNRLAALEHGAPSPVAQDAARAAYNAKLQRQLDLQQSYDLQRAATAPPQASGGLPSWLGAPGAAGMAVAPPQQQVRVPFRGGGYYADPGIGASVGAEAGGQ